MRRLFLAALFAAVFHALLFWIPAPSKPLATSSDMRGSTISVSVVQAPMAPKAKEKKAKPKREPEKKIEKPKKRPKPEKEKPEKPVKPRRKVAKKRIKSSAKVVEPIPVADEPPVSKPEPKVVEPQMEELVAESPSPAETSVVEEATEVKEASKKGGKVSAQPGTLYAPEPNYPRAARKRGYEGTVLLEICVNGKGVVEEVKLKKSCGYGVLDRSAIKGVKRWRFSETGGLNPIWFDLPVTFRLALR